MQSDRQLLIAYNRFNKDYFNGELSSKIEIVWEPYPKCDGVTCPVWELSDGIFQIKVDPALKGSPCYWRIVLLHECVHVAVWRQHPNHKHGKVFKDEVRRLFSLGAYDRLL
jgi:hypothetical protein